MRLVITGTGRCGTGYVAKVLQNCESITAGHEFVFGPHGPDPKRDVTVDVSWLAIPYLPQVRHEMNIGLLYRHPAAVISSFLGIGFFDRNSMYLDFMRNYVPDIENMEPFDAACHWYVASNQHALNYAHFVTNIDSVAWEKIVRALHLNASELAAAIPAVSQTYNHRARADIDLDDIPGEVWATYELLEGASRAS